MINVIISALWVAMQAPWLAPEEQILSWPTNMSATAGAEAYEQHQTEIAEAELLGRRVFDHDRAAARATDLVFIRTGTKLDPRTIGWIEEPLEQDLIRIYFFGELEDGNYFPIYSADVRNGEAVQSSYRAYSDDAPFEEALNNLAKARMMGSRQPFQACSNTYNTVVFETGEKQGEYYVYLLPGTTDAAEMRLGGNYRFRVDLEEGVTAFQKYTNSCLIMRKDNPNGDKVVALVVSQILTPYPTEIHVFMSLLHDLDLYVVTVDNKVLWRVSGDKITPLETES